MQWQFIFSNPCPLLRHIVIVLALRTSFLGFTASRLMLHLTLPFAFSRSGGRLAHYYPRECRSILQKSTCTKPFCLYVCNMFNSNKSSQHNSDFNMPYKLSNAHGLHSFCIQDRPDLPCSVVIKLQPPTTGLLHAHQHALHTHAALSMHSTAFHNSPMCTNNKHKAQLAKWHKMCHSHLVWLVFEGSIPACTCFYSENVLVTLHI